MHIQDIIITNQSENFLACSIARYFRLFPYFMYFDTKYFFYSSKNVANMQNSHETTRKLKINAKKTTKKQSDLTDIEQYQHQSDSVLPHTTMGSDQNYAKSY